MVDENTIGVVAILGVTYNGVYEPVKELAAALDDLQARTGLDIPLHVDGASGAFIAPFLDPGLVWDFRLPRVHSISTSGHKFGLVYPGLGWVVWAKAEYLPEDLIFSVSYLGGNMPTLALNFSARGPGAAAVLQLPPPRSRGLSAGAAGVQGRRPPSRAEIAEMGPFEVLNDGSDMPLVTWTLKEGYPTDGICMISRPSSGSAGGRCPRIRCRPTSRT